MEPLSDDQIDTADAQEILDRSYARRGVFYSLLSNRLR